MSITLDIEYCVENANVPSKELFSLWLNESLNNLKSDAELSVRIVGNDESQQLNRDYRQKDKPTNVLSFPYEDMPGIDTNFLGDLAICAPVVEQEAQQQQKDIEAHWAHMLIHGTLHLLGYDHITEQQATEMETLEQEILHKLGFDNPYRIIND